MKTLIALSAALLANTVHPHTSLNVLTFNIYAKPDFTNVRYTTERMERICETLKSGPWDIVMLQEVWTASTRKFLRSCGYPHVMDLNKTGEVGEEGNLGSGLMILSKFPLVKQQRLVLSRPAFNWAAVTHGEVLVWKSVYLAQAELPTGNKVWLANTHLVANYCKSATYEGCDSYESERFQQAVEAAYFLKQQTNGQEVIFAGDFNSGPHPYRNDKMWQKWDEVFPGLRQGEYDVRTSCTSCGTNFFKEGREDSGKLDHIFASSDLAPFEGRVVLEEKFASRTDGKMINLSDHYGWESMIDLSLDNTVKR